MSKSTQSQAKTQDSTDTTFLTSSQWMDTILALVEFAAFKFLAITTAFWSWSYMERSFSGIFSNMYCKVIGMLLIALIVDFGLPKMISFCIRMKHDLKASDTQFNLKKMWLNVTVFLLIIRLVVTGSTTWIGSYDISEAFTEKGNEATYATQMADLNKQSSGKLKAATALLDDLKANKDDRIEQAKKQGELLISKAFATGDRYQKSSYKKEGFAWLTSEDNKDIYDHQYADRIKAATALADSLVLAEGQKIMNAEQAQLVILSDDEDKASKQTLNQLINSETQAYQTKLKRKRSSLWILDAFGLLIGICCTYLRTIRKIAAGVKADKKSISYTLSSALAARRLAFINWLEGLLQVDINQDGTIGGKEKVVYLITETDEDGAETIYAEHPISAEALKQMEESVSDISDSESFEIQDLNLISEQNRIHWKRVIESFQNIPELIAFCRNGYRRRLPEHTANEQKRQELKLKYILSKERLEKFGIDMVPISKSGLKVVKQVLTV